MYLGRFQLGQQVPLFVLCHDDSDTPIVPDDVPVADVWAPDGTKLFAKRMPVTDRYVQSGLFLLALPLDRELALGSYRVVYHWTTGSYRGLEEDGFELVAGGHQDGAVIGAYFWNRPNGTFIVQQCDTGRMIAGRNPRI